MTSGNRNKSTTHYPKINANHLFSLLDIKPSTVRTYELEGLVRPTYSRGQRFFSHEQVTWVSCIRHMIQEKGISIPGLTRLLRLCPCWEIADCPKKTREQCSSKWISMEYLEQERKSIYFKKPHPLAREYYMNYQEEVAIN